MQPSPFVTIRGPSCGSGDVRALEHGRYACGHCQSSFRYTGERMSRPVVAVERPQSSGGALVAVVAVVMLVFGGAVFFLFFAAADVPASPPTARAEAIAVAAAPRPVVVPTPRPVPVVAPPRPTGIATPIEPEIQAEVDASPPQLDDFQELRGCACARSIARLHVQSKGRTTMLSDAGLTTTRHLEFAVVAEATSLWRMPTTEASAPAVSYTKGDISMGVGCNGDTLVIAAGTSVSAWSLSRHTLLWSHTLDAPFGKFADGTTSDMGIDCETLRPSKDTILVRAGKRTVKLALADGAVR